MIAWSSNNGSFNPAEAEVGFSRIFSQTKFL